MRLLALVVVLAPSASVLADPVDHLELTGFFGVDDLSPRISLGSSQFAEQRPQTAMMFGGRLTYMAVTSANVELGVEAALAMTPSYTGYGFDGPRDSYFAPVLGYRADAIVRWPGSWFQPFLLGGAGGATVVSHSPYLRDETDAVFFWAVGASFVMSPRWMLRFEGDQAVLPGRGGPNVATYEAVVGITARFGATARAIAPTPIERQQDEIAVRIPPTPREPPIGTKVGRDATRPDPSLVAKAPLPDLDGDGLVGAADKCPDQPEDFDGFEDADGCPDPDNDHDGIPDAVDKCPNRAETVNGWEDEDGCPDEVPADIAAAFAAATAARFEPGKARLTAAGKLALDHTLIVLREHPKLRVQIQSRGPAADHELSQKRADTVKWYLVEQGVAADQLQTLVVDAESAAGAKPAPMIELMLAVQPRVAQPPTKPAATKPPVTKPPT